MGWELDKMEFQRKIVPVIVCNDERFDILLKHFSEIGGGNKIQLIDMNVNLMKVQQFVVAELVLSGKNIDIRFTIPANNYVEWFLLLGHGVLMIRKKDDDSKVLAISIPKLVGIDQLSNVIRDLQQEYQ